jgi:putative phosphoesterase
VTTLVGVIADTHVPQRLRRLPAGIDRAFDGVSLILHAGDINCLSVLVELGRIAPVLAVTGNADPPWWKLPRSRVVEVEGCRIGLTHGHGGWRRYLADKVREKLGNWRQSRYLRYAREAFQDVDVIVTGHTHRPHLAYVGGTLLFNPGTIAPDYYTFPGPTVGRLRIEAGVARAEIAPVGWRVKVGNA